MNMTLKLISIFIILFSFLLVSCSKPSEKVAGSSEGMAGFMPNIAGESLWKQEGGIKCYKGEELFNYIDGGAELFHDYGFKKACVQDYQKGDYLYTVEIYEMENSPKAFGVYSINREGTHPQMGQEAAYQEGFLNIWKGRYYIKIFTSQKGADMEKDILFLGEKTASRIEDTGEMPSLSKIVPASAIKDKTVSFYKMGAINNIFFISHENILNLNGEAEGITFLLPMGKENIRIVIIRYPNAELAKESIDNTAKGYFSQPPSSKGADEYRGGKKDKAAITKSQGNFLVLAVGDDEKDVYNAALESLKSVK